MDAEVLNKVRHTAATSIGAAVTSIFNSLADLIDNLSDKYGCLDGLLLNAGILGDRAPISQYDVPTWVNTLHVNLTAQFILTQTLLPALYKSKNNGRNQLSIL